MGSIERNLGLFDEEQKKSECLEEDERLEVLAIAMKLAQPDISWESRHDLVSQMFMVLMRNNTSTCEFVVSQELLEEGAEHPPPVNC